jgi:4-amino-4-deoxychorismate lyase
MSTRCLVNGVAGEHVPVHDRGFGYGDGLFETIRVAAGALPLWPYHLARLAAGCRRLGLAPPDAAALRLEVDVVRGADRDLVVKVIVTRGAGERGYAPPPNASPTRVVLAAPLPDTPPRSYRDGIAVRWCSMRLALQPALAGIKHLNRLEQVLARAEWSDPAIGEGLLCDGDGRAIGATAANLFAVCDGVLVTPGVDRCGVAGVLRAWMLDGAAGAPMVVRDMLPAEVESASEVFVGNSVRGVLPVSRIGTRTIDVGPVTRAWQQRCATLGLAPSPIGR